MKTQVLLKDLVGAVKTAKGCLGRRSSLPILSYVKLSANGRLQVAGCNLEQWSEPSIECRTEEGGDACVNAKDFLAALKGFSAKYMVELSTDEGAFYIGQGFSKRKLEILPADEYPMPPADPSVANVLVSVADLRMALRECAGAMCEDETKPIMCGIMVRRKADLLEFVSTDTHRLSVCRITCAAEGEEWEEIVPWNAVNAMLDLLALPELGEVAEIGIERGKNNAYDRFTVSLCDGYHRFVTRVIDGKFPNWERIVMGIDASTKWTLPVEELRNAAKGLVPSCKELANRLGMVGEGQELILHGGGCGFSHGQETVAFDVAKYGVPPQQTYHLNVLYLIDALANMTGEVEIRFQADPLQASLWMEKGNSSAFHIIMPMRPTD